MSFQDSGVTAFAAARALQPSPKFFRLSQLRQLRDCQQVAAVCYRIRRSRIEFLLVQTRSGHWTFPKGAVEPGLTQAQAAALEAFEEAGVHGRMQEALFTRYIRRKRHANSAAIGLVVNAFLCEVLRLGPPQESGRNRTWLPAQEAKQHLREDRAPDYANELARVIDRAVTRIRRLYGAPSPITDTLQRVKQISHKTKASTSSRKNHRSIGGGVGPPNS